MNIRIRSSASVGLLCILAAASPLAAQGRGSDQVSDVLERVRSGMVGDGAIAVLAQERGLYSRAERDALADSLVKIALVFETGGPIELNTASRQAMVAIAAAGAPERAQPYDGALSALARIFEGSGDASLRATTLWFIAKNWRGVDAREYLASVASSEDDAAYYAVGLLGRETGPPGIARLQRLHRASAIHEARALAELAIFVNYYGWR